MGGGGRFDLNRMAKEGRNRLLILFIYFLLIHGVAAGSTVPVTPLAPRHPQHTRADAPQPIKCDYKIMWLKTR